MADIGLAGGRQGRGLEGEMKDRDEAAEGRNGRPLPAPYASDEPRARRARAFDGVLVAGLHNCAAGL